jgi:biopolymer transport protein ExbB
MIGVWELFLKGGPIMWPILVLSIVAGGVVLERLWFLLTAGRRSRSGAVEKVFGAVERGDLDGAAREGQRSSDRLARILAFGLEHRHISLSNSLIQASGRELDLFNRGITVLDTAVTLGPLLGLLGTVLGMIRAFGVVGSDSVAGKTAMITGGIAESLIAVSFGLAVAIVAIIPLNYLNSRLEKRRREIEEATNHLELLVGKHNKSSMQEAVLTGHDS